MKVISMKGLVEKSHGKICQDSDSSVAYRKKEKNIQSKFTTNSKIAAACPCHRRTCCLCRTIPSA